MMSDKVLNFFDECTVECVHLCPQAYTPGTIANSQRTPTKVNKNGAIAKVRILVE